MTRRLINCRLELTLVPALWLPPLPPCRPQRRQPMPPAKLRLLLSPNGVLQHGRGSKWSTELAPPDIEGVSSFLNATVSDNKKPRDSTRGLVGTKRRSPITYYDRSIRSPVNALRPGMLHLSLSMGKIKKLSQLGPFVCAEQKPRSFERGF